MARAGLPAPRARLGYFPCNADGNELVVFDPEDPERELERLVFPRQPRHDRICLADFYRPIDSGERDVVALQGVTVGPEVTELIERLEREGEFAEQLYVHGLGVQSAEGLAEWLHSDIRRQLGIDLDQGRRYSWGYPACPDQSEHEKVWRLLGLEEIGMTLSGGYAVMPEQSTVAIVAHHGGLLRDEVGLHPRGKAPDELIAGTERGGELPPESEPDEEPEGDAGRGRTRPEPDRRPGRSRFRWDLPRICRRFLPPEGLNSSIARFAAFDNRGVGLPRPAPDARAPAKTRSKKPLRGRQACHRVFRGAYAVGHPAIGQLGRMQAATLAVRPESGDLARYPLPRCSA